MRPNAELRFLSLTVLSHGSFRVALQSGISPKPDFFFPLAHFPLLLLCQIPFPFRFFFSPKSLRVSQRCELKHQITSFPSSIPLLFLNGFPLSVFPEGLFFILNLTGNLSPHGFISVNLSPPVNPSPSSPLFPFSSMLFSFLPHW